MNVFGFQYAGWKWLATWKCWVNFFKFISAVVVKFSKIDHALSSLWENHSEQLPFGVSRIGNCDPQKIYDWDSHSPFRTPFESEGFEERDLKIALYSLVLWPRLSTVCLLNSISFVRGNKSLCFLCWILLKNLSTIYKYPSTDLTNSFRLRYNMGLFQSFIVIEFINGGFRVRNSEYRKM